MSEIVNQVESVEKRSEKRVNALRRVYNATVVTAAGGSLVFEQSPANEAIRINAGLDVLQSTGSAPMVGLTIFGITAAIEGVSSGLITAGLHTEGGLVQKMKEKMQRKDVADSEEFDVADKKRATLGKVANAGANVGIALGLGAGLVTVKEHVADPSPSVKKDIVTSAKATGIVSTVSGGIGYLAAGGIANAEKIGLETPAQYVVDYGTDTRFWMTVLAVGYGGYFAKRGINKLRNKSDESQGDDSDNVTVAELQKPTFDLQPE